MNEETLQGESEKFYFEKNKDALLEEYRQLRERTRTEVRSQLMRETIFIPLSLGALAAGIRYFGDLDLFLMFLMSIVSIALYVFVLVDGEKAQFYRFVCYKRLDEIENISGCMKTSKHFKEKNEKGKSKWNDEYENERITESRMPRCIGKFICSLARLRLHHCTFFIGCVLLGAWVGLLVYSISVRSSSQAAQANLANSSASSILVVILSAVAAIGVVVTFAHALILRRRKLGFSLKVYRPARGKKELRLRCNIRNVGNREIVVVKYEPQFSVSCSNSTRSIEIQASNPNGEIP